ncbi:MAG: carboxymuconolactone decarboxylase family protein [Melioribacteraceae bacterium]
MNREEINSEIKKMLGIVPTMFNSIPDNTLEEEWSLFKKMQLTEGLIPLKYQELMGLAISSVSKCKYCVHFHTEVAKLFGATNEEIETAIHFSKQTAGWSAYINGLALDFDDFKDEMKQITTYVRKAMANEEKRKEERYA